jgi:hypothetical protein
MKTLGILGICIFASSVNAANYYVTTNGNNSADGSINTPWLTVQKAVNTMQSGDSVLVGNGTFAEVIATVRNGTEGSPITITGSEQTIVQAFGIYHDWITLDNIQITDSVAIIYAAISLTGSNTRITRNRVYDINVAGLRCVTSGGGLPSIWPTNVYVGGNIFTNIYQVTRAMALVVNDSIIESNRFESCACDIFNLWGDNNIIRRNTVTNILRDLIGLEGSGENHNDFIQTWRTANLNHSTNNLIEANLIVDAWAQMGNLEEQGYTNDFHHWTFRNNVFANCRMTFNVGIPFCSFFNNTFWRSPDGSNEVHSFPLIFIDDPTAHGWGAVITNNLFIACGYSNAADGLKIGYYGGDATAEPAADYNYFAGLIPNYASTPGFTELHGINGGDPLFVNSNNGDVRLQANSPAIGAGANLSAMFTTDFYGNTRTNWDIGAVAFGGVYIPPEEPIISTNIVNRVILGGKSTWGSKSRL